MGSWLLGVAKFCWQPNVCTKSLKGNQTICMLIIFISTSWPVILHCIFGTWNCGLGSTLFCYIFKTKTSFGYLEPLLFLALITVSLPANSPRYENASIFGANWLTTEWYPSRQLFCWTGDACFTPLSRKSCSVSHIVCCIPLNLI